MSGVRFCTSCQCNRDMEGGVFRRSKRSGRWICSLCLAHKTESIYKNTSGRAADVQRLMTKLYEKAGI